jgi:hypothetical protein
LCRTVHARSDRHIRPTGDAHGAAETLATWRGACRDLTILFLAAVRNRRRVALVVSTISW